MLPKVKICCISSVKEANIAIKNGASLIGLVSEMPSGPGIINESEIKEIARSVPPGVTSVLLTSKTDVNEIAEQHKRCCTNSIQIVDDLTNGTINELKELLPGINIIQVVHVIDKTSVEKAHKYALEADALLLDSGTADKKKLGGTGKVHNWEYSKEIVDRVDKPVFLAGGIGPENVAEAFNKVKPFGIDLCSGIRTDKKLDSNKLTEFFNNLMES